MTREEAIKIIDTGKNFAYDEKYIEAFDMAIEALKLPCDDVLEILDKCKSTLQIKSCEDIVKREHVIKVLEDVPLLSKDYKEYILGRINMLPTVTQKPIECEDCISRHAVDKFKSDIMGWINSNNRGSADYFIVDKIEELVKGFNPLPKPYEEER